jgi:hypothetical protein
VHPDELRQLFTGPDRDEPDVRFVDRIRFQAPDPREVLARIREVLQTVLSQREWLAVDAWRSVLPDWFVTACLPEQTPEEAEGWLRKWRSLNAEEKVAAEAAQRWALTDWLYWFNPAGEDRGWAWWDAGTYDDSHGWVEVAVEGDPYPSGALRWLLHAAGATVIE